MGLAATATPVAVALEGVWVSASRARAVPALQWSDAWLYDSGERRVHASGRYILDDDDDDMQQPPSSSAQAVEETEGWARLVVELNLCPWARAALDESELRCVYVVSENARKVPHVKRVLDACVRELRTLSSAEAIVLAVLPNFCRHDFQDFYQTTCVLEDFVLDESDAQLAGFHPEWTFAGLPKDDPVHFEKRAPHPTISIVHADAVASLNEATRRVARHNEDTLKDLGYATLLKKFRRDANWFLGDDNRPPLR